MCSKLSPITCQARVLITEEASRLTCGCVALASPPRSSSVPARRISHQLREARVPRCSRLPFRSCVAKEFSELPSGRFTLICRESRSHGHTNGSTNGINWSAFPQPCWRFRSGEFKASGHSEHHLLLIPLFLFLFSGSNPHTGLNTHSHMHVHTHM